MISQAYRGWMIGGLFLTAGIASAGALPRAGRPGPGPIVVGLDHIPLAVRDLDGAAERYRQLGFVLKPGSPHANGIRNLHAKFRDGTEIELITATQARDALADEYLRHLVAGNGPAFVALYAPDLRALGHALDSMGKTYRRDGGFVTFAGKDESRFIFFGSRNRSPTDRPEHFDHPNGALALAGVWLAGDDLGPARRILGGLGVPIAQATKHVPDPLSVPAARLLEGEVLLLPAVHQRVPGRRIVGATLRVRSIAAARKVLAKGGWKNARTVETQDSSSLFLPPDVTHGIWLEFREAR